MHPCAPRGHASTQRPQRHGIARTLDGSTRCIPSRTCQYNHTTTEVQQYQHPTHHDSNIPKHAQANPLLTPLIYPPEQGVNLPSESDMQAAIALLLVNSNFLSNLADCRAATPHRGLFEKVYRGWRAVLDRIRDCSVSDSINNFPTS